MDENKTAVIVFGGGSTGLGVIRSLGRRGVPVIAADYNKHSLAFSSKYVRERILLPGPEAPPGAVVDLILEKSERLKHSVLIAADDYLLTTLSRNKSALSERYTVAVADWSVIEKCLDKRMTYQVCVDAGVPTSQTFFPDSEDFIEKHQDEFQYPCILKPIFGHRFSKSFKIKAFKVNNFDELQYYYRLTSETENEMIIQEIIPGTDDQLYTYYAYRDLQGDTLAEFTCRKLRQTPPSFGVITAGESTHTPELTEPGRAFLDKLGYTGVCGIEFKRDSRDNQFKLIENNARFGVVISLPIKCGVDLPWVMYCDLTGREKIRTGDYPAGTRWTYLLMDIVAFFRYPDKNLGDFICPYRGDHAHAIYASDDPMPLFKEWGQALRQLPGFLMRTFTRRHHKAVGNMSRASDKWKRININGGTGE